MCKNSVVVGEAMIYLIGMGCGVFSYLFYRICIRDLQLERKRNIDVMILTSSLIASVLFSMLFRFYGYGPLKVIKQCLLMAGLILIAWEDAREKRIPNRWLIYLTGMRGILIVVEAILYPSAIADNLKFTLFGGIASFLVLFMAYVISRHEIGFGDVKLFTVIGVYLGMSTTYFALLLSLIIAAFYGGAKLIRKRMGAKDEIAFGPFVAAGTIIILGLGF